MIAPARSLSYELLCHIEVQGDFSDDALHSERVNALQSRDRNMVTEIVYGVLRWRSLLDHVIAQACALPWSRVDLLTRILFRMSLYQMWHMQRVPDYALVDDAVELAKQNLRKGAAGFVNGVLRTIARHRLWEQAGFIRALPPWTQVSLPRWLWDRWSARFGEKQAHDFALSLNMPPKAVLRLEGNVNVPPWLSSEITRSDIVPGAYLWQRSEASDQRSSFLLQQLQDEASQLVPHLLGPVAGWRIWDACAAPGGKSLILRDKCGRSGRLVASDRRWKRAKRLVKMLDSNSGWGARSDVLVADARRTPPFRTRFDAVLADVPCSGLGVLRRNPEIKWRFDPDRLPVLQKAQLEILHSAAEAVRTGGILVYATCSTEPEENEQVVETFLASRPEFQLEKPAHPPGIERWSDSRGMVRTFPGTRSWDGFFAALMVRFS